MPSSKLRHITDIEALKADGLPFQTVDQVRWAFRKRHENGLAGAFFRNGRSVLVDTDKAHELLRAQVA